jgi:hypothetical protein
VGFLLQKAAVVLLYAYFKSRAYIKPNNAIGKTGETSKIAVGEGLLYSL